MKIEIAGWVHARRNAHRSRDLDYVFFPGAPWTGPSGEYIPVCEYVIKFELPASFDPISEQVKALEKQKTALQAEFQARITEITAQINSFLAIEA